MRYETYAARTFVPTTGVNAGKEITITNTGETTQVSLKSEVVVTRN